MRLLSEIGRNKLSAGASGKQIVASGDMTNSITSSSFLIEHMPLVGIQVNWASGSSPVGSLQLQGSIDGTNYFDVGSSVAVSGNAGVKYLTDASAAYLYCRFKYTATSGSATMNAYAEAKGF